MVSPEEYAERAHDLEDVQGGINAIGLDLQKYKDEVLQRGLAAREVALVCTKLEEASMWLDKAVSLLDKVAQDPDPNKAT